MNVKKIELLEKKSRASKKLQNTFRCQKKFFDILFRMLKILKKRKVSLYHQRYEKSAKKSDFFIKKYFWRQKLKKVKFFVNDHFAFICLLPMLEACLSGLHAFLRRFLAPFRPLKIFQRFHGFLLYSAWALFPNFFIFGKKNKIEKARRTIDHK